MKSLAALFAALIVCAGASTAALGTTPVDEATYIAAVEVVQDETIVPAVFANALREAVLREAAIYGAAGRPITLRIELNRVHYKNAAAAMLIGDDNQARGHVAVLDQSAGQQLSTFSVDVDGERPGEMAAEIALGVIGAFDPTGAVDMASMAGSAASADIDRAGAAAAMIANFTAETLRQTFGAARTRAAKLARENEARAP